MQTDTTIRTSSSMRLARASGTIRAPFVGVYAIDERDNEACQFFQVRMTCGAEEFDIGQPQVFSAADALAERLRAALTT